MFRFAFYLCIVATIVLSSQTAVCQIRAAWPSEHCFDENVDSRAVCTIIAYCTQPPDPIEGFTIGADAYKTCSEQPVDNLARVDATINSFQALAQATATALFTGRIIKNRVQTGSCDGTTAVLRDFEDPYGCNPPPPPPPPDDGEPICDLRFGTGGEPGPCSPVILDVIGKGFHLTGPTDGVQFDIVGNGHPIQIAWTEAGSGNAFLVLDRNGNGTIDDGHELFGNFTYQPESPHPNGFLALAVYDQPLNGGNGNGVIDDQDSMFSSLRLWMDENHDGISQSRELFALSALGVYSVSLDYRTMMRRDDHGNVFRYRSLVNPNLRPGETDVNRAAYDVFLAVADR